jgi:hypothetical protein
MKCNNKPINIKQTILYKYLKILLICILSKIIVNLFSRPYIIDLNRDLPFLIIFPIFYVLPDIVFKSFHWPKD